MRLTNANVTTAKVRLGERCGSSPGMVCWQWGLDPDPTNLDVIFDVKTEATALSAKDPLARDIAVFEIKGNSTSPLYHVFRSQSSEKAFAARVPPDKI